MTKAEYQSCIWEYKRRRSLYRNNYTGVMPLYKTRRYIILTRKISQWNKEIKRLDIRKEKIGKIVSQVNKYFNVKIQDRVFNKEHNLARQIYFKLGLESKICGTHLLRFIGRRHEDTAAYNRRVLIKSFKIKKENKEAYHSFKKYLENNK